jgi:hypothetical protein
LLHRQQWEQVSLLRVLHSHAQHLTLVLRRDGHLPSARLERPTINAAALLPTPLRAFEADSLVRLPDCWASTRDAAWRRTAGTGQRAHDRRIGLRIRARRRWPAVQSARHSYRCRPARLPWARVALASSRSSSSTSLSSPAYLLLALLLLLLALLLLLEPKERNTPSTQQNAIRSHVRTAVRTRFSVTCPIWHRPVRSANGRTRLARFGDLPDLAPACHAQHVRTPAPSKQSSRAPVQLHGRTRLARFGISSNFAKSGQTKSHTPSQ